jgi:WD40 repeat protein
VAILIACILIGSVVVVLRKSPQHDDPATPRVTPTSQAWDKMIYRRSQNSMFSNASYIAWSPDNKRVASLVFTGVQIWDATTGAHPVTFKLPVDQFGYGHTLAWSPNGKWIAIGADMGVAIFNAQTGVIVYHYTASLADSSPVHSPTFSMLPPAGSSGPTLHNSSLSTFLPASGGSSPWISGVAWSPDSLFLAITKESPAASQRNFSIINAQTGALVHRFSETENYGIDVASWSSDGKYLAASVTSNDAPTQADGVPTQKTMVWVWNTSNYQVVFKQDRDESSGDPIQNQLAWQPQSDHLVFSKGNISPLRYGLKAPEIELWDVTQNKLLKRYNITNTGSFAWSPDGKYLATGSYANHPNADQIAVINIQSGHQIYYQTHEDQILSLAWSPDNKYIVSSGLSTMEVWTAP